VPLWSSALRVYTIHYDRQYKTIRHHHSTYCSKKKNLIWRYFWVKYVRKSYTNRYCCLFTWKNKFRSLKREYAPWHQGVGGEEGCDDTVISLSLRHKSSGSKYLRRGETTQYKELPSMFGTMRDRVQSARAFPPIRRLIGLASLRSERQQWRPVALRHQVKWINIIFDLFFVKVNEFHWKMCGLSLLSLCLFIWRIVIPTYCMRSRSLLWINGPWSRKCREPTRASPHAAAAATLRDSAAVPMCWAFAGSAYKVTWHLLAPVISRVYFRDVIAIKANF